MQNLQGEVSEWLDIDNEIKLQSDKLKELRSKKNSIEESIMDYATSNNMEKLAIKTDQGILKMIEVKSSSPLTFKYIEQCLKEIIANEDEVEKIINYIKEKRTFSYSCGIKKISN